LGQPERDDHEQQAGDPGARPDVASGRAERPRRGREPIQRGEHDDHHGEQHRPAQPFDQAVVTEPEQREDPRQRHDHAEHHDQPDQRAARHPDRDHQLVQRRALLAHPVRAVERVDQRARRPTGGDDREHDADAEREAELAVRPLRLLLELPGHERDHVGRQQGREAAQVSLDLVRIRDHAVDRDHGGERGHDGEDREQRGAPREDRHLPEQRLARRAQPLREERIAGPDPADPSSQELHW
jgi:hypothetical protein